MFRPVPLWANLAKTLWGPKGVGPELWEGPKFRAFFPLPPLFSLFFLSLGVLLVEFWWCLKRRDPQMCTFGVLGLSCETPAALVTMMMVVSRYDYRVEWARELFEPTITE